MAAYAEKPWSGVSSGNGGSLRCLFLPSGILCGCRVWVVDRIERGNHDNHATFHVILNESMQTHTRRTGTNIQLYKHTIARLHERLQVHTHPQIKIHVQTKTKTYVQHKHVCMVTHIARVWTNRLRGCQSCYDRGQLERGNEYFPVRVRA